MTLMTKKKKILNTLSAYHLAKDCKWEINSIHLTKTEQMKQKYHKDEYPAGRTGLAKSVPYPFMHSLTSKLSTCQSRNASIPLKIVENFLRLKRADYQGIKCSPPFLTISEGKEKSYNFSHSCLFQLCLERRNLALI